MNTVKIITNDFESIYNATNHLIEKGCRKIIYLSISKHLNINSKRMEGYKKALQDHHMAYFDKDVIECSNDKDENYILLKKILSRKNHPESIIASVEKLTTPVYLACKDLKLSIPKDVKVISFSNLETALILNPALTTVRQPAYEMGKTAAAMLFKAIEKKNFQLKDENIVISSRLIEKESTM